MHDDAIPPASPSVPSADAQPPAASVAAAAGGTDPTVELLAKIERAGAGAVEQHIGESKKYRGQRGPDKKPRVRRPKIVPLETLGTGTGEIPGDEAPPVPLTPVLVDAPAFDEETAKAVIDVLHDLANDGAASLIRAIAKNETGDDLLAKQAGEGVRMSEKIEASSKLGWLMCCRKWAVRMEYAPEALAFGTLAIWGGSVALAARTLKEAGAERRARAKAGQGTQQAA